MQIDWNWGRQYRAFVAMGAIDDEVVAWIGEQAKKRPRADIVVWSNQKRDLRLSELPLELQEYMEDTIPSVALRHRALYRFSDM